MKKLFLMAGIILLAASCSNESELTVSNEKETAPVRVRVSDFSMSMGEILPDEETTRAVQDVANYNSLKAIVLAFYNGSTEIFCASQIKGDGTYTSFGEFSCNLPIGTYTMVVIGRNYWDEDIFVLTSPTVAGYISERPRETFCHTRSVTISNTNPVDLTATLERIVAQVTILSTDGRTSEATKVRTTYAKGGKGFNPTTGLAISDVGFSQTNTPSAAVGETINIYSNVFLASDEETMNITIEALDADDNVLFTKEVPNVPLKRNRKTTLSGPVYTSTALTSSAFLVETSWLDGNTVDF